MIQSIGSHNHYARIASEKWKENTKFFVYTATNGNISIKTHLHPDNNKLEKNMVPCDEKVLSVTVMADMTF